MGHGSKVCSRRISATSGTRLCVVWVNVLLWRSPVAGSGRGGPDPATGALLCPGPENLPDRVGGVGTEKCPWCPVAFSVPGAAPGRASFSFTRPCSAFALRPWRLRPHPWGGDAMPDLGTPAEAQAAVLLRRRRLVDADHPHPAGPTFRLAMASSSADHPVRTVRIAGRPDPARLPAVRRSVPALRRPVGARARRLRPRAARPARRRVRVTTTEHVPLFRGFPESVPGNTETFYINRVFARLAAGA